MATICSESRRLTNYETNASSMSSVLWLKDRESVIFIHRRCLSSRLLFRLRASLLCTHVYVCVRTSVYFRSMCQGFEIFGTDSYYSHSHICILINGQRVDIEDGPCFENSVLFIMGGARMRLGIRFTFIFRVVLVQKVPFGSCYIFGAEKSNDNNLTSSARYIRYDGSNFKRLSFTILKKTV